MQLTITHQLPQLNDHIGQLYQHLGGDLTPLMKAIGGILENSTRERFSSKIAPDGTSWQQLKPSTVKQKKGRGGSILVERGDLMKSITHHATSHSVTVGTNRHYGKYHQVGTKHMPARPFLGISASDGVNIQDVLNQFLREAMT